MPKTTSGRYGRTITLRGILTFLAPCLLMTFLGPRSWALDGVPLRGFSEVSYVLSDTDDSNSFVLGNIDFYLAKPLDHKVNYLIEMNFSLSRSSVTTYVERAYLQYVVSPWFKVAAGRFHTALGYWNDTYHHGSYLQTSVSRPTMESSEVGQGFLPLHTIGIEIRGNGLVGPGNLGYIFNVGNGRGQKSFPPTNVYSFSKSKSLGLLSFYELPSGLRFGANIYYSELPGGKTTNDAGTVVLDANGQAETNPRGHETIVGAHLVYNTHFWEFISEYSRLLHHYSDNNPDTHTDALYAQLGVHIDLWTPYVRYEINRPNRADAYLRQLAMKAEYYVAGLRYELSPATALKLELSKKSAKNAHDNQQVVINWSYGW